MCRGWVDVKRKHERGGATKRITNQNSVTFTIQLFFISFMNWKYSIVSWFHSDSGISSQSARDRKLKTINKAAQVPAKKKHEDSTNPNILLLHLFLCNVHE